MDGQFYKIILAILSLTASIMSSGCDNREQDVQFYNKIDQTSIKHINEFFNLEKGEIIIAFYDHTISMDGSDIVVLTNKRVGYSKDKIKKEIFLTNIQKITTRTKIMEGVFFTITDKQGDKMEISIGWLMEDKKFLEELKEAAKFDLK